MRLSSLGELLAPRRPRVDGANSSSWSAPPLDPRLRVPVPFACAYDDGRASLSLLNNARVTQCALSRICGVCGGGLDRPVAFVGTALEQGRNAFHFPPLHAGCAASLTAVVRQHGVPLPGQEAAAGLAAGSGAGSEEQELVLVTCSAFEFVRPTAGATDRRPVFTPTLTRQKLMPHSADPAEVDAPRALTRQKLSVNFCRVGVVRGELVPGQRRTG
jgi:hypothetical protein